MNQAEQEVDAVIEDAHKMGIPRDVKIAMVDVRTLMIAAYRRGMAAERENYASRSTNETSFGGCSGKTQA